MTITLHQLKEGKQCSLFALGTGNSIATLDFMEAMRMKKPKELDKLNALLARTLEHGVPKNRQKCNTLGNGLFEFKTRGGLRLVWFWDEQKMIVCTHGFTKARPKTPRKEIEKALARKADYFEAKANGSLGIEG